MLNRNENREATEAQRLRGAEGGGVPVGQRVEFPSNGHTCQGYFAAPQSGSGPAVVVIQEWWGLVPHIEDVVNRFSKEGFAAIAPDLFHGKTTRSPDEAGKMLMELDAERAEREIAGAGEWLLKRPECSYRDLPGSNHSLSKEIAEQVEFDIKYQGYIDRQESEIEKFRHLEGKRIPKGFDYNSVPSLRTEARTKLSKIEPATIGQASRISGVSPADISILMVWLKRASTRERLVQQNEKPDLI